MPRYEVLNVAAAAADPNELDITIRCDRGLRAPRITYRGHASIWRNTRTGERAGTLMEAKLEQTEWWFTQQPHQEEPYAFTIGTDDDNSESACSLVVGVAVAIILTLAVIVYYFGAR